MNATANKTAPHLALVPAAEPVYRVVVKATGAVHYLTAAQLATMPGTAPADVRFVSHGIKVGKGPLQKARMWLSRRTDGKHVIAVHAKLYSQFSAEVWEAFEVRNNTDTQTDYFERDHFDVPTTHPLFLAVASALRKRMVTDAERYERLGKSSQATHYREQIAELDAVTAALQVA